ncbi:uncharacterized protein SPPG_08413 [Spizellomyces punctatus DAOM BR117]|uniref:Uncharacterized protein n=1 Tax=Spizellomyces punctatus (strain DAOM BR117) TaxID=645134 RepID=A0A0L0H5S4_SPIPD|nr:uncharacterized protein SPPG_08413 [Spizellomyces punctatus DAOM BR117]KNC96261.1 hypothetical protein SPPG_08413 [Spizellomyces punctatus DAOM BR117]|eukprot:XP_016604301.1 hypothetical protein SPPG_08413 [Spizellomyces punctatus DAOM BR117]
MSAEYSAKLSSFTSWRPFIYSTVVQLSALSIIRRGTALILPRAAPTFALAPTTTFGFGYSAEKVYGILDTLGGFGRTFFTVLVLVNFALILATAFNLSILTTLGLKASGLSKSPASQLNLLPFAAAALHALENIVFLAVAASPGRSDLLAGLAGTVAVARDLVGTVALGVVVVTLPVFLAGWAKSIGRDGRQRVPIVKKTH